jgi:gas vesicle protein
MYNSLNDAKNAATHGVEAAAEAAEHAFDTARKGVGTAKHAAEHSAASVLATMLKGLSAAATITTMLRRLDLDDGLSWFGLARRRSSLSTFAIFGAGVVVGTGVGFLFAPVSGAEARRAIRAPIDDFMRKGADVIQRGEAEIEHKAEEIGHKAEELAAKAETQVKKVVGVQTQERPNLGAQERPNGRPTPATPRSS